MRIGINLGDVVVDGDDLLGDGVNVAARLEGLADPGGICVSRKVLREVRGKTDAGFTFLGERKVKNLKDPVPCYRVDLSPELAGKIKGEKLAWRASLNIRLATASAALFGVAAVAVLTSGILDDVSVPNENSIAVLTFEPLSDDARTDRFARAISNNVATDLAQHEWLRVRASGSSATFGIGMDPAKAAETLAVNYVLSGGVQVEEDDLEVSAKLTGKDGVIQWSERWRQPAQDFFDVQDEILVRLDNSLASNFTSVIASDRRSKSGEKPTDDLETYELLLIAVDHKHSFTPEGLELAEEYFQEVFARDPEFGEAWGLYASLNLLRSEFSLTREERDLYWERFLNAAREAIEHAPDDPWALVAYAFVKASEGDLVKAGELIDRAADMAPNNADILAYIAVQASQLGVLGKETVEWAERAMALNPNFPPWYRDAVAFSTFNAGDYEKAARTAGIGAAHRVLAAAGLADKIDEVDPSVIAGVTNWLKIYGRELRTIEESSTRMGTDPELTERLMRGLALSGWNFSTQQDLDELFRRKGLLVGGSEKGMETDPDSFSDVLPILSKDEKTLQTSE